MVGSTIIISLSKLLINATLQLARASWGFNCPEPNSNDKGRNKGLYIILSMYVSLNNRAVVLTSHSVSIASHSSDRCELNILHADT